MNTYRDIFGIREFRALFLARCFFMAGVVMGGLALGTVMYATTGSPVLTALAMFGGPLVQLVSSHFLLATADLVRPRNAICSRTSCRPKPSSSAGPPSTSRWVACRSSATA